MSGLSLPAGYSYRETADGRIVQTWPHNGLARITLDRQTFEAVLRHKYPFWPERKIQRALAYPWRFRKDVNWALTLMLTELVEGLNGC